MGNVIPTVSSFMFIIVERQVPSRCTVSAPAMITPGLPLFISLDLVGILTIVLHLGFKMT
jgi:hypothetical protein